MSSRSGPLLATLGWLFAAELRAEPSEALQLTFSAPAECGDHAALERRIEARAASIDVIVGEAPAAAVVEVAPGTAYRARVRVSRAGVTAERELSGLDCGELLDAVALVVVVTLDTTRTEPAEPPATELPTEPAPVTESTAAAPGPTAPTPAPTPAAPANEPLEWQDDIEPPDLGSPIQFESFVPEGWGIALGARAHLGPAPEPMLGPEFGLELSWNPGSVVSTRLAVTLSRAWSEAIETSAGTAEFTLDQIQGELCPVRLGGERWAIRPCLQGAGGRLSASGNRTDSPESATRQWGTLGASARASVLPIEPLELWASAGVGAALVRDRFQFEPVVFHAVPGEIPTFAVGLAAQFE